MLDPFINSSPHKSNKASRDINEEKTAQQYGRAAPSTPWLWRLGHLLIRIGTKLTKGSPSVSNANKSA